MSASVSSSSTSFNCNHELMAQAFKVVEPLGDWRDPIKRVAERSTFDAVCSSLGVSFADVLRSVEYFTATAASVSVNDLSLIHI